MTKEISCDCGTTVRGMHDDDLVARTEDHVEKAHPEMKDEMSREKILEMAQESAA
jgi:predicted small metal-binding protein